MEDEVLPVEAQATMRTPLDTARVMHAVMPGSLTDPVGLLPWCLIVRWTGPAPQPARRVPTSGVEPSESDMIRVSGSTNGISSRNRHTPLRSIGSPLSRRWCQARRSSSGLNGSNSYFTSRSPPHAAHEYPSLFESCLCRHASSIHWREAEDLGGS